jgi:two-component sensor histidine kinase
MEEAVVMQNRTATLFAELQHRVANNLTFLTAVLDRQARQLGTDGPVPVALQGIKDRLMAMSCSHRRLYDPRRLDEPIGQYLGELCAEQIANSGLPVTHSITCGDVVLDLDQLMPVVLIVSELITNCLKHGFKERSAGQISISLRRCTSNQEVELTVADDGCGVIGPPKGKCLGQTIVGGLAAQLGGKMTCASDNGTTVTVRFPLRKRTDAPMTAEGKISGKACLLFALVQRVLGVREPIRLGAVTPSPQRRGVSRR